MRSIVGLRCGLRSTLNTERLAQLLRGADFPICPHFNLCHRKFATLPDFQSPHTLTLGPARVVFPPHRKVDDKESEPSKLMNTCKACVEDVGLQTAPLFAFMGSWRRNMESRKFGPSLLIGVTRSLGALGSEDHNLWARQTSTCEEDLRKRNERWEAWLESRKASAALFARKPHWKNFRDWGNEVKNVHKDLLQLRREEKRKRIGGEAGKGL